MYPLLSMFLFSLTMSISPGPVNLVIISSGVHHGVRSTQPFVSGATLGFTTLLICVGAAFQMTITANANPIFMQFLTLAGSAYIAYLGYRIATAPTRISIERQKAPSFGQGWFMQWINPKAWIACISGVTLFSAADGGMALAVFVTIYFLTCYASLFSWSLLGERLANALDNPRRLRGFNLVTGGLLIASVLWMLGSLYLA